MFRCIKCKKLLKDPRGFRGHLRFKHNLKLEQTKAKTYFENLEQEPEDITEEEEEQQTQTIAPLNLLARGVPLSRVRLLLDQVIQVKEQMATIRLLDNLDWDTITAKQEEVEIPQIPQYQPQNRFSPTEIRELVDMFGGGGEDKGLEAYLPMFLGMLGNKQGGVMRAPNTSDNKQTLPDNPKF